MDSGMIKSFYENGHESIYIPYDDNNEIWDNGKELSLIIFER